MSDNNTGKEPSMKDVLGSMFKNNKYNQPFKIVAYSGELPEELKQFVNVSPTCAKGDNPSIKTA